MYEFSYSNKGHGPYVTHYIIECTRKVISEIRIDIEHVPPIKPIGPELPWIFLYNRYVPKMVEEIRSVASRLNFEIRFLGRAMRLEDAYKDPHLGVITALTIPTWQGRQKSLKAILRGIHELYVAALIADSLEAKTLDGWYIEYASNYSTAILEANGRKYKLWFQFSFIDWLHVTLVHGILGHRRGRWYVRPDIVVFDGAYKFRKDLEENPPHRILLIDAKLDVTKEDLRQLIGYRSNLEKVEGIEVTYIVATLERVAYKPRLEEEGYIVVENVNPIGEGKEAFKKVIEESLDHA